MNRIASALIALLLILAPGAASAADLVFNRTVSVVSDTMGNTLPRVFTDSVVDYKVNVSNPAGNLLTPVRNVVLIENIPAGCDLQVTDIATAGKGPIEFMDGSLLGTGLLTSGLTFTYSSTVVDSVEFYNGVSWVSNVSATSGNYNPSIRAVRITLAGTFASATAFQLRYRVRVR